jgi:hypothetical protein
METEWMRAGARGPAVSTPTAARSHAPRHADAGVRQPHPARPERGRNRAPRREPPPDARTTTYRANRDRSAPRRASTPAVHRRFHVGEQTPRRRGEPATHARDALDGSGGRSSATASAPGRRGHARWSPDSSVSAARPVSVASTSSRRGAAERRRAAAAAARRANQGGAARATRASAEGGQLARAPRPTSARTSTDGRRERRGLPVPAARETRVAAGSRTQTGQPPYRPGLCRERSR